MGLGLIAINLLFVLFVLVVIPGPLIWAIRTAHRDHVHHAARRAEARVMEAPAVEPKRVEAEPVLPELELV